jgi:hypothetical protein
MIGKQINFYLTDADQLHLLRSICKDGGCALVKRSDDRPYHVSDQFERAKDEWAVAYICEPSRADRVLDSVLPGGGDSSSLLAIEFIQCVEEDGAIQRGRLWYAPKHLCEGVWIQKPKDFIDWADGILARAKRELARYGNGDWIGPEAKSRLDAGNVRLSI